MLRCSRCLGTTYCASACQRKMWPTHKRLCEMAGDFAGGASPSARDARILSWEKRAAEGHVQSQFLLASSYDLGSCVAEDPLLAVHWYEAAAEGGHARATNNLGSMYFRGAGVRQDVKRAASLYKRAAEMGDSHGMGTFAMCLEHGHGVAKDTVAAAIWRAESLAPAD